MIYNCLSNEEELNIKSNTKKHKALAITSIACALVIIILMYLLVNRSNIRYAIPIFTLLFTICISIALFINFSFIKIEKEYLNLLIKAKENHNQITIGKITNDYQTDTSAFGRIKCFNIKVHHEEKDTIYFLEQTANLNLEKNIQYKFTTYRHFILKIEEVTNETSS